MPADYSDLPEWVRPGKVAYISSSVTDCERVTVRRATPARIVIATTYDVEYQCDRESRRQDHMCRNSGCDHASYRVRNAKRHGAILVPAECRVILRALVSRAATTARAEVAQAADSDWNRGEFYQRRRDGRQSQEELVLEWLDHVENTVRKKRDALLKAIERRRAGKNELEEASDD